MTNIYFKFIKLISVFEYIEDKLGLLLGQRDKLTPPHRMFSDPDRVDGSNNIREFILIGELTVRWLLECGLKSDHKVLDVGCGIGRMAIPLTKYLNRGSYEGLDITKEKVNYCRRTITKKHPNFNFQHADLYNKYYNPNGKYRAAEYKFPYENGIFDFIFLISVFTHMLPEDMDNYLNEISRVLKYNGKCVITFFLTNTKLGDPYIKYSEVCHIYDENYPEHGVFYNEEYIRTLFTKYGLKIEMMNYGSWSKREGSSRDSFQDRIIAYKKNKGTV